MMDKDRRIAALENQVTALQAESNYYRRIEFAQARESNLEWWLAVFKEKLRRGRNGY